MFKLCVLFCHFVGLGWRRCYLLIFASLSQLWRLIPHYNGLVERKMKFYSHKVRLRISFGTVREVCGIQGRGFAKSIRLLFVLVFIEHWIVLLAPASYPQCGGNWLTQPRNRESVIKIQFLVQNCGGGRQIENWLDWWLVNNRIKVIQNSQFYKHAWQTQTNSKSIASRENHFGYVITNVFCHVSPHFLVSWWKCKHKR